MIRGDEDKDVSNLVELKIICSRPNCNWY